MLGADDCYVSLGIYTKARYTRLGRMQSKDRLVSVFDRPPSAEDRGALPLAVTECTRGPIPVRLLYLDNALYGARGLTAYVMARSAFEAINQVIASSVPTAC